MNAPAARIHILPAREAPVAIVIRRKPSKRFHVLRWHTDTGEIEPGSWFNGKLYPLRADISWCLDGLSSLGLHRRDLERPLPTPMAQDCRRRPQHRCVVRWGLLGKPDGAAPKQLGSCQHTTG